MTAFEIAVEESTEAQEWVPFKVGGEECLALATPTTGQVAYVTMMTNRRHRTEQEFKGMLNFLDSLLHEDTREYIMEEVLLNPKVENVEEILVGILRELMEFWSGRPTQSSSDSLLSPAPSGDDSNQTTQGLISSDSPFIASATTPSAGSTNTQTQTVTRT